MKRETINSVKRQVASLKRQLRKEERLAALRQERQFLRDRINIKRQGAWGSGKP